MSGPLGFTAGGTLDADPLELFAAVSDVPDPEPDPEAVPVHGHCAVGGGAMQPEIAAPTMVRAASPLIREFVVSVFMAISCPSIGLGEAAALPPNETEASYMKQRRSDKGKRSQNNRLTAVGCELGNVSIFTEKAIAGAAPGGA
jgi:hypothetical protein